MVSKWGNSIEMQFLDPIFLVALFHIRLLAMTIRLTPQMIYGSRCVFLQRIYLLIGKIWSCLQKIAKYGKLCLVKNNRLVNLIKKQWKYLSNNSKSFHVFESTVSFESTVKPRKTYIRTDLSNFSHISLYLNILSSPFLRTTWWMLWVMFIFCPGFFGMKFRPVCLRSLVGRMRRLIVVVLTEKGVFVINHPGCFCLGLLCCNAKTLLWMSLKTVIKFFVVRHVIAKGPYCFQSSSFLRSWW